MVVAIVMMVPVVEVPVLSMRGSCSSMKTSSWSTVKAPRRSAMESTSATETSASTTHLRVG